jgi:hypothetical protein
MSPRDPPERDKLPRRDFFILPLLSIMTIAFLWGAAEVIARLTFRESGIESCGLPGALPGRMKPNCISLRKAAEGPEVEMSYNDCGYRTKESCGTRPEGVLRIALLGASTTAGYKVPFEETFGQRVSATLTRDCGRPVEVQNLGIAGYELVDSYMRTDEALALKPDLVMFVLGSYDIEAISDPIRLANRDHPERLRRQPGTIDVPSVRPNPLLKTLVDFTVNSRAIVMAQHYLYSDRDSYVKLFMLYGDKADYVRLPLSPLWEKRLSLADMLIGGMARKVHAAGLPFFVVFAPSQLEVALLTAHTQPAAVDADAIGHRLAQTAARNASAFLDTLDDFRAAKVPAEIFYPVDGHLNGKGHAILANAIIRGLTGGAVGTFAGCKPIAADRH